MTELLSVGRDGAETARLELERCVQGSGVAIFPADGLYGLACDPMSAGAIERIHALKGRDAGKPSAVMYFSPLAMREVLASLGPRTREAAGALLPGPVTLIVANPERRFPLACREDQERLGLRLIEGPLAGIGVAVMQTSANRSGEPPPHRFEDIDPGLLAGTDLAIDGGELTGEPSTVVDLTRFDVDASWRVLRPGAMATREIERAISPQAFGS